MYSQINKANTQLIAHCFFTHGKVYLKNYEKYYKNQEKQQVKNTIEMQEDY